MCVALLVGAGTVGCGTGESDSSTGRCHEGGQSAEQQLAQGSPAQVRDPMAQSAREAVRDDARTYAASFDVSLHEAIRRLRMESRLDDAVTVLMDRYPDSFAGAVIRNRPDFTITVRFACGVPDGVANVLAEHRVQAVLDGSAASSERAQLAYADGAIDAVARRYGDETTFVASHNADGVLDLAMQVPPDLGDPPAWKQEVRRFVATLEKADFRIDLSFTRGSVAIHG